MVNYIYQKQKINRIKDYLREYLVNDKSKNIPYFCSANFG